MAKKEKVTIGNIWGSIYPALLYLLITSVVAYVLLKVGHHIVVNNKSINIKAIDDNMSMLITFFSAVVTIPLLIVIKYLDVRKQKMLGGYGYRSVFFAKYLLIIPFAAAFMYAANCLVALIEIFVPSIAHSFDDAAKAIYGADMWIQIVTAVLLGPIVEELIFRGLMYIRLKRMFGQGVAAFVTGLLFGIFHWNISQGIYAFLFSYAAIFIYEKYKNICAPIIMHIAANAISVLVSFMVKDYNNQSGATNSASKGSSNWLGLLIICIVSAAICGLFAYAIRKWVDPKRK